MAKLPVLLLLAQDTNAGIHGGTDRLVAVNMSAGHSGGVSLRNLANLPICLQTGHGDHPAYIHTRGDAEIARCSQVLDIYQEDAQKSENSRTYYKHDCFVHLDVYGQPHNGWGPEEELTHTMARVGKNESDGSMGDWYDRNKDTPNVNSKKPIQEDNKDTYAVGWLTKMGPREPHSP